MKKSFVLYFCVIFASLAGMISGFDTGVISGAILYIQESFFLSSSMVGVLVGCVSIGAIVGALINGFLVDKIGRRKVLILSALIFLLGSIFCSISQNITQLVLSRAFIGCAVGMVSFVAPLYLSEISNKKQRGAIVSFYQIALTFGILFSYFVNYFCSNFELNWRLMLFIGAIPSLILLIGMSFQSDTPRWYVLKNKIDKAKNVLLNCNCENIEAEIDEIKNTISVDEKIKLNKKLLMPFVIGIGIMFVQIATGINAIIYYAPTIFKSFGLTTNQDALFITIFIGLINFLMTFVATIFVDKIGRKPLIYLGLSGMLISLIIIASAFVLDFQIVKYLAILSCALYIVSFQCL